MELTIDKIAHLGQDMCDLNLSNNIKYNHFQYNYYKSLCGVYGLDPYFEKEFGNEYNSLEFFEKNKYRMLEFLEGLRQKSHVSWIETSKRFGQDYASLVDIINGIIKVSLDKDIKSRIEALDSMDGDGSGIHEYASTLSFLKKLYDNNLSGRRIIEVGARNYGVLALTYLKSLGADTYALDRTPFTKDKLIEESGIRYILGRWEDIAEKFDKSSVDAIYINYMHPSPHSCGRFDSRDDNKWSEDINAFEKHIADEMRKILKPNGVYVMRQLGNQGYSEYLYFNKKNFSGYSSVKFKIEECCDEHRNLNFRVEDDRKDFRWSHLIWDKNNRKYPLDPADRNIYFGDRLIVFQKRT